MTCFQLRKALRYVAVTLSVVLLEPDAHAEPSLRDFYEIAHVNPVRDVRFSPDGDQLLSLDDGGILKFWKVSTGKNIATMRTWSTSIVLSPDGKILAQRQIPESKEATTLWDASSRTLIRVLTKDPAAPDYDPIAFSPDGRTLASWGRPGRLPQKVGNFAVKLWDVATGKNSATFEYIDYEDGGYHPLSLAFSSDGKQLAVSGVTTGRKKVRVWDLDSRKNVSNIYVDGDVTSVAFSPDGKSLVLGGTGGAVFHTHPIILWDLVANQQAAELLGHTGRILHVAFSPDGKLIASCGECDKATEFEKNGDPKKRATVRLWDVDTGRNIAKLQGHTDHIRSVAFSSDGRSLVSGSIDRSIRIWDVSSSKPDR